MNVRCAALTGGSVLTSAELVVGHLPPVLLLAWLAALIVVAGTRVWLHQQALQGALTLLQHLRRDAVMVVVRGRLDRRDPVAGHVRGWTVGSALACVIQPALGCAVRHVSAGAAPIAVWSLGPPQQEHTVDLGPFTITPAQVEALAESFVPFVNALLAADCAAHGVRDRLSITDRENDPDEGLDAVVRDAPPSSTFVPAGISGWQFKRSSLPPRELAEELRKPGVQRVLREGGIYCLAVAKGLTPVKKKNLTAKFADLVGNDRQIRVLNAKDLADWAGTYPAVLALPALGVNTGGLIGYRTWASRHPTAWVADTARDVTVRDLQARLRDPFVAVTRVEEPGGMGAGRLVLEALRDPALAAWAVYAEQPDDFDASVANYLERGSRKAIVVVNRCDRDAHRRLARRFVSGGGRLLITVGAGEDLRPVVDGDGVFQVGPMAETDLDRVVEASFPRLPWAQRRFVAEHADGSVEFAILLAERLLHLKEADAADVIASADPETVLRLAIPVDMADSPPPGQAGGPLPVVAPASARDRPGRAHVGRPCRRDRRRLAPRALTGRPGGAACACGEPRPAPARAGRPRRSAPPVGSARLLGGDPDTRRGAPAVLPCGDRPRPDDRDALPRARPSRRRPRCGSKPPRAGVGGGEDRVEPGDVHRGGGRAAAARRRGTRG